MRDRSEVRKIAENKSSDRALEIFRPLANKLMSDHWAVFTDVDAYERLTAPNSRSQRLTTFSFLGSSIFEGFASVTVAGACFKDSIFYKSFSKAGVKFVEADKMKKSLRFSAHQNGASLTIYYATDRSWSKHLRDSSKREIWTLMVERVKKLFEGEEFLWSANKDIADDLFDSHGIALRLPRSPHGLNEYQEIDNVAFLSAHNLLPAHAKFVQDHLSVSRSAIEIAIHRQHAYQAILRSSLRDSTNKRPKKVFVPDLVTAEWLQGLFHGSKLEKLDCGLRFKPIKRGRPKTYSSSAGRTKGYRERLQKELAALFENLFPKMVDESQSTYVCDVNAILKGNFVTHFRGSVFRRINDTIASPFLENKTVVEIETLLKQASKRVIGCKEDNILFCPALFDPELSTETSRGKENFVVAYGIWLDFDGGDLEPKDLAGLFPRLRMTVYATYSSKEKDLRFRVFIPTSHLLTYDVYVGITKRIKNILIEKGYPLDKRVSGDKRKAHGLDLGKLSPISLFYAPCKPQDPKGGYFKTFKDRDRQPLNVEEWLEKIEAPEDDYDFEPIRIASETKNEERARRAIQQWAAQAPVPGVGNRDFWRLACHLAAAGCALHEISSILNEQVRVARHPDERRKEIPRIINLLNKEIWLMGAAA